MIEFWRARDGRYESPAEPAEPEEVCTCAYCKQGIYEGEDYIELDGNEYHEECFTDAAEGILLEMGAKRRVAEGRW